MLDRGVYETLRVKGKGADFPFDGGTAEITGRCKDCSPLGWDTAVHEADRQRRRVPRPDQGRRHRHRQLREPGARTTRAGTRKRDRLLGRPAAHRRAGATPASTTSRWPTTTSATPARPACSRRSTNVTKRGIEVSGAGKNLAAARKPAILEAAGTKVAILGYDAIAGGYHATATKVGSAPLDGRRSSRQDVAAARKAGADVVIVFPHWGTEYDPTPFVRPEAAGAR